MAESTSTSFPLTTPNGSSRHEKSLGLLTVKFVTLLQEAKDGVLDLKVAADSLAVKQKRRIYDITNVLEGVGLIEKKTKNTIQWRGENSGCQPQEVLEHLEHLKANIADLDNQEQELDRQKSSLQKSIKRLNQDPFNCRYPLLAVQHTLYTYSYVTNEDICDAFTGDTLLAVMAPAGTQLEVPVVETGPNGQKKYQVNLRSYSAPIQVMLINRESSCSKPVVVSVPPVDDFSAMPTPPSTPAGLQWFPVSLTDLCDQKHGLQKSTEAEHQLTPDSESTDIHMECNTESPVSPCVLMQISQSGPEEHQREMGGPDLQSMLEEMRDEREAGVTNLIDELMSSDVFPLLRLSPNPGVDYTFNLDENEGVCDLFDVQILNY
ncbi:hypothetical protein DNTS_035472 [Danionella cerebrum]|uniref:E2F/DP family winged-helix DNA-binding domain-containing protein n=1 Tax=Danionella cerebrum TaxID=2873325 RepID=A0A553R641_9TELE|nr:hypothetical protein DNTS_035472 [Danionella translucida]TRY97652.1 hypothetical protein DNTS_035472 [Danionella translucida]